MASILERAVSSAREALASSGQFIGPAVDQTPRFELFNASQSICSQKVRCVLAHHDLPYIIHALNLFVGQTYLPEYVRLRMIGCDSLGGPLVSEHSGSTSTSAGGCDGAVVPTLIDWQAQAVVVDSKRICIYLDAQVPDERCLRPSSLTELVDSELEMVDNLPNYQLLMGRKPKESEATKGDVSKQFSLKKVAWCDRYLEEYSDDGVLTRAYSAKRAKELSAANKLFSPEPMQAAYARAETAVRQLDLKLQKRRGAWLFGDEPSMADLFWGIELIRMKNVGVAHFWEGRLPRVEHYAAASESLPSIRKSVIDWPGATF